MGDSVHYHLERMLPELKDLEEKGIFSKTEIKSIVKQRTSFEYALHRRISKKSDFLRYIEYEINLERLRRKRKKRLGLDQTATKSDKKDNTKSGPVVTVSDFSLVKRIHSLYQKTLKKFGGDEALWVQYFEWCKSVGSSKALGRNFAKAIQLHPTKPTFWIAAASYEFSENNNITSSRVLLQRGIRINPECTKLWIEYFKLELLWVEKIKLRRKVLFGGNSGVGAGSTKMDVEEKEKESADMDDDDEENEDDEESGNGVNVVVPQLQVETNSSGPQLGKDTVISKTTTESDDKMSDQKSLSDMQQMVLQYAIPRAVYKNAIKAVPRDLDFRREFLKLYRELGPETKAAQQDVYESILADFTDSPDARAVLCERHFSLEPLADGAADPGYPAVLKKCIMDYNQAVEDLPHPQMWTRFMHFVRDELNRVDEENLKLFLTKTFQNVCGRAHACKLATEEMYLEWYARASPLKQSSQTSSRLSKTRLDILEKALETHPSSLKVWETYLDAYVAALFPRNMEDDDDDDEEEGSNEDLAVTEDEFMKSLKDTDELFHKALAGVSAATLTSTSPANVDATTRACGRIWAKYCTWLFDRVPASSHSGKQIVRKFVEDAFMASISHSSFLRLRPEHQTPLLALYLNYLYTSQSSPSASTNIITSVRSTIDELTNSTALRAVITPEFLKCCVDIEEKEMEMLVAGPARGRNECVKRIRGFYERIVEDERGRVKGEYWAGYVRFEEELAKDISRASHVRWRASKVGVAIIAE
ncbi:U3 snoRNP protein [Quaeritorhiza haematococci]|nr:U3 snoRNP protein [Quaeritorhiza haematococci]